MPKLIIFDLDGTLLNTIEDLGTAVNHTLKTHGLPVHPIGSYKMRVGRGMRNLVKASLPSDFQGDDFIDGFLGEFLNYYMTHIDSATLPYPGIVELIRNLDREGYRLAIASNKMQAGTERLISKFFPGIHFVAVCGNSPSYPLKPDPALIRYIIGKAGSEGTVGLTEALRPEDCVMVGDSGIDIRTAKGAGIPVIAVTWGFRPVSDLQDADHIATSVSELASLLRRHG